MRGFLDVRLGRSGRYARVSAYGNPASLLVVTGVGRSFHSLWLNPHQVEAILPSQRTTLLSFTITLWRTTATGKKPAWCVAVAVKKRMSSMLLTRWSHVSKQRRGAAPLLSSQGRRPVRKRTAGTGITLSRTFLVGPGKSEPDEMLVFGSSANCYSYTP